MKTDLRKWLAFGTGIAIEIRESELQVTIARLRPSKAIVLGSATVTDFKSRPAAEWGSELIQFLRKLGCRHISATVLLPRRDLIVRQIALPGVSDSDMASAVELQIDGLHPFGEEEVYYSWAKLGKSSDALVGITRREIVDSYVSLFAEAGVKVNSFTYSAAVMYSAWRLGGSAPDSGFLAVRDATGDESSEVEYYGESAARPVFSAMLPANADRAVAVALSELRLDQSSPIYKVEELLPRPSVFPPSYDPDGADYGKNALAYGTALVSACPWLTIDANLLPATLRRGSSRIRLIPTIALSVIAIALAGVLAGQSKYEDSRYLALLQTEIRNLEPKARKVDVIDRQMAATRARTQSLDEFRRRTKLDIDTLGEVTRLVAAPGWLNGLEMDRNTIQFGGEVDQATTLVRTLDNSPYFAQTQFTMPITRQGMGEAFRLKAVRENPALATQPVSNAAVAVQAKPAQAQPSAAQPSQPTATPPQAVSPSRQNAPNPFSGGAK